MSALSTVAARGPACVKVAPCRSRSYRAPVMMSPPTQWHTRALDTHSVQERPTKALQ